MSSTNQEILSLPFPMVDSPGGDGVPAERPAFGGNQTIQPVVYSHINLSMAQLNDALRIVPEENVSLEDMEDISEIARPPAKTQRDVDKIFGALEGRLQSLLEKHEAIALFGLFTPPLRAKLVERSRMDGPLNLYVFESFNRHDENGNFNHLAWKLTARHSL